MSFWEYMYVKPNEKCIHTKYKNQMKFNRGFSTRRKVIIRNQPFNFKGDVVVVVGVAPAMIFVLVRDFLSKARIFFFSVFRRYYSNFFLRYGGKMDSECDFDQLLDHNISFHQIWNTIILFRGKNIPRSEIE